MVKYVKQIVQTLSAQLSWKYNCGDTVATIGLDPFLFIN
jgi:hypothetical protein